MKHKRAIRTVTFQPTRQNLKRLAPLKKVRGHMARHINAALDLYFSQPRLP